ncbi:hypothetical protein Hanom_Chr05g00411121 [Helianthus anomalus]
MASGDAVENDTAFPLKDDQVTLFAYFFKFYNFRLPITKFCKSMLDEYAVHISQMHPLGLAKLRHFEYFCLSLGFLPDALVFHALYMLVWKAPFFTFDRKSTDEACLRFVPSSSREKDWKNKIFFLDDNVILGEMHWRVMAAIEKVKDVMPPKTEYKENALFKALIARPSECLAVPDGALALFGMSLCWRDSQIYHAFRTDRRWR